MAQATSPKGPATYKDNQDRAYNSKAKMLIYGGDERPDTPQHIGKKSVNKRDGLGAPFATYNDDVAKPEDASKDYHSKPKTKDGASKPTGAAFNADVYREQLANNYTNMQASKARNYGGSNIFGGPTN
ncbi:hypothetical protein CHLRE_08g367550v5 [Chlamydomonas reinhardtii]|jgi:hypothetical protein|uniref:Uncharacterized protein n=1 Tax=Chlamydomonas reinhardtii TaxID=3055 RepID=A0A2K3DGZ5_CHLRE|nr:uncharacterized protein CHLRE_08g367550v5 [Chlamydomonas reinhardtii]PNW79808.1 hypothetical protein CHLRE_08g367550v5 [Chlamydomonas reinhardtii]